MRCKITELDMLVLKAKYEKRKLELSGNVPAAKTRPVIPRSRKQLKYR